MKNLLQYSLNQFLYLNLKSFLTTEKITPLFMHGIYEVGKMQNWRDTLYNDQSLWVSFFFPKEMCLLLK